MNPILRREFFVRWRDWRSYLLLLGLSALLCAVVYWSYNDAIHNTPLNTNVFPPRPILESLATRASRTGHALFSTLALGNVVVWFLMAPLLTATGVARERERGLLESLQLSHMTPRSQVFSRALSALLYLFALQLMTLPVYFVAFSFGGVSPAEIARAWLLVGATAWCGVGLGLMLSASASRPSGALFGAVGLLCGWSLAAYMGWTFALMPGGLLGIADATRPLAQLLYWSHPAIVVANLCQFSAAQPASPFSTGSLWPFDLMFPLCLVAWLGVGAFGLRKATRDVTRAFAPAGWAGRNTLVERWKSQRQKRLEAQRQRANDKLEGALLADLPFDRLIHFKNPLLNREVKGRFRLRRASTIVWVGRIAVFLFASVGWVLVMTMVFDPVGRASGVPTLLWTEWLLGVVLVGTFASSGFVREREAGTWEGIRLSLLSSGQIARTKWAAPLIAFTLLTCPLWLLLFAFAPIGDWKGVPFRVLFASALAIAASLSLVSALAQWISVRARNTTTATCWTLGTLVVLFWVAPTAWALAGGITWSVQRATGLTFTARQLNPDATLANDSELYEWCQQPEVRDLYSLETGRIAPYQQPGYYGSYAGTAPPSEVEQYRAWCSAKQKQAVRVAALSGTWSSSMVLASMRDPKEGSPFDANTLLQMALLHALLCAIAITLLLGAVTLRLNTRPE